MWKFKKIDESEWQYSESNTNHFFDEEEQDSPCRALVREGIQNSLDALNSSEKRVKIRIFIDDVDKGINIQSLYPILEELIPHLQARENAFMDTKCLQQEKCRVILFEDYNTIGLNGDLSAGLKKDEKNPLLSFFRAEGISNKQGSNGGRWGIGKTAFPRASKIHTIFGLSKRTDDERTILFGKCHMKNHFIDDVHYHPLVYFCDEDQHPAIVPITSNVHIEEFCGLFNMYVRDQFGLSIIIPFIKDDCTYEDIVLTCLSDYQWPLLKDRLEILIETESKKLQLDSNSMNDLVLTYFGSKSKEYARLETLADRIHDETNMEYKIQIQGSEHLFAIADDFYSSEQFRELQYVFESNEDFILQFEVPVILDETNFQCSFELFFKYMNEDYVEKPIVIRDNLFLSDLKMTSVKRYQALMVFEGNELATLLGNCETVSHQSWSYARAGDFGNAKAVISFIKQIIHELIDSFDKQQQKNLQNLLDHIFSLEFPHNIKNKKKVGQPPGPGKVSGASLFGVSKKPHGFVIKGTNDTDQMREFELVVAYMTARGNPFASYKSWDFNFGHDTKYSNISITSDGSMLVTNREFNRIAFAIAKGNFVLEVDGFDPNRAVEVKINEIMP